MKEVYPGIFRIRVRGGFGPFKPEVNVYVLAGPDGLVYDAGYGTKTSVRTIAAGIRKISDLYSGQGRECRITRIIPSHSHPDHFSGLKRLREMTGAKIVLPRKTAGIIQSRRNYYAHHRHDQRRHLFYIKNPAGRILDWIMIRLRRIFFDLIFGVSFVSDPDEIIEDTSDILINGETWKIFPSPGHASDHISLYNPVKGILFGGDNILRTITPWLGPPDSNLDDYLATLENIASLKKLDIIFSAHGSPVENPRVRAMSMAEARRKRTRQVYDLIRRSGENGLLIDEILLNLYRGRARMKREMGRGWVALTLMHLESQGLVKGLETRKGIFFISTGETLP